MSNHLYDDWNHKRVKAIIDHYNNKFFYMKSIVSFGVFDGDIEAAFLRLGADVSVVDPRQSNLDAIKKKHPALKTIRADLDHEWPITKHYDIVLSLGLMCHLKNFEDHLRKICSIGEFIILETEVLDTPNIEIKRSVYEDKVISDLSYNGEGVIVSAAAIQNKLSDMGAVFKRLDDPKLNSGPYVYNWKEENTEQRKFGNRRFWFIRKDKYLFKQFENNRQMAIAEQQAKSFVGGEEDRVRNQQFTFPKPVKMVPRHYIKPAGAYAPPIHVDPVIKPVASTPYITATGRKKFVIVIPSYKNEKWCEKNIQSCIDQNYNKYRVIFTDDCSPDSTFLKVQNIVNSCEKKDKFTLIKNDKRIGALANLYNMIHSCDDDEIILTLDGDDHFPDGNVLSKLNKVYSTNDIWMTYGQYKNSNDGGTGVAQQYPQHVIDSNNFRGYAWGASHLRTFYTWLFKKIRKEDLMYNGQFYQMTWDLVTMIPMLEQSGNHSKFISDILYVYNLDNPINDHKVDGKLQQALDRHIRGLPRYQRCEAPLLKKEKIGLMFIATGKYDRFLQSIITSADKHFLKDKFDVSYFIFSDKETKIETNRPVINISVEHKPYPFASMDRFKHFTNNADKLKGQDYLFYCDVDSLFVDTIGEEIIGDLVGVRHCGYTKTNGPFETNQSSLAYVDPVKQINYYGGGMSGGSSEAYLALAKTCYDNIDKDLSNDIIACWADESHINKYFSDHPPDIALDPGYHYPEGGIERYKKLWEPDDYKAKILLLDKNHSEIRT